MPELSTTRKVIRFGLYEVDLASQELRKSGIKIKLQEQPFQILALLLERPGEIVTREQIQKRLWAGDTFVDFDLGLNSAVKKLRQALGDESDNPRFVETLYRRGYRFLAPVHGHPSKLIFSDPGEANPSGGAGPAHLSVVPPLVAALKHDKSKGVSLRKAAIYLALPIVLGAAVLAGYGLRPPSLPRVTGYQQITRDGLQKYAIVSDGERLYLEESESGRFVIGQVSSAGGETSLLQTPFSNAMLGDIAADGSALFIGEVHETNKHAPLWSLPLPSGPPRRIGDLVVESIAPSPDGKWLVCALGSDVFQVAPDGAHAKKLFSVKGPVYDLSVSPDSRQFVFNVSSTQAGTSTLWMANSDGSNLHAIFPEEGNAAHDSYGRWTPDGKFLVFQRYRDRHDNIWVLPLTRSWFRAAGPIQLTNGPLDFENPAPSRDGKKVFAVGAQPRSELVRFEGKSGFKPFLGGLSVTDVAFSNDGQWISYVSVPDSSLWRSRLDGSERLQLTDPRKVLAGLPRWSPDRKKIVFMGRTASTNWRAYLISSSGGNFQDLIPSATAGLDPNWMPDGKSIVLSLANLGPTGQGVSLLNLETGKVSDIPGGENYFSPRPSPDGKWIAAVSTSSDELVLYDVATQRWTGLAKMPIGYPSWSRDGQYIYFDSILSDDPSYNRVRISDHKLERLTSLSGIRRFWGEMAEWAGLAPDDSLLLTRDASNQEVYAIDWLPN